MKFFEADTKIKNYKSVEAYINDKFIKEMKSRGFEYDMDFWVSHDVAVTGSEYIEMYHDACPQKIRIADHNEGPSGWDVTQFVDVIDWNKDPISDYVKNMVDSAVKNIIDDL